MSNLLEHLNKVNEVKIHSVFSDEFALFGRVLKGIDFSAFDNYLSDKTEIPAEGNIYVASVKEMESLSECRKIRDTVFGGTEIQAGYCNGRNTTYNGFEYHKMPEINFAVTDFMLVLGHVSQIENNKFHIGNEKVFYVPEKTAIEMYGTTLHLSPCRVHDEGFRCLVILPEGTNTPLENKEITEDPETRLLLQKNKWVLAHPDREPLIKQGAHPGFIGENRELRY